MGASNHPTTSEAKHSNSTASSSTRQTQPVQTETTTMAVFIDPGAGVGETYENLQLIKRVEVPRYSLPTSDGVKLSRDKQLSMAVTFAVTAPDSTPDPEMVEGAEFMVMDDLDAPMKFVTFERNPAIAGCWNPNQESAANFAGVVEDE